MMMGLRATASVVLLVVLAGVAPSSAQRGSSIGYRVDVAAVPNLEALRRLFQGCTDLGTLEPSREALEQAPDLEQLRSSLESLGIVTVSGCPRRVQDVPGVSPLGGLLPVVGEAAREACQALDGAYLENSEREYLGVIASEFEPESIFNVAGPYGDPLSATSIWNPFGAGGQLLADSPWNPFSRGLAIMRNDEVVGYLTVNTTVGGWVHPVTLGATCYDVGGLIPPSP